MSLKVISLFSGAGGLDIGFEKAGFEIAIAIEKDPACCNTLKKNKPNLNVVNEDVSLLSGKDILDLAGLEIGEAALVIGGPPCQSFSLAGKREGLDDNRGQLVLDFVRIVQETLPFGFVMENVKGMYNWAKGKAIAEIQNQFEKPISHQGINYQYNVKYKVLNASHFGVPQQRERLFVVGNRLGKDYQFPSPVFGKSESPDLFEKEKKPVKTVWDAIGSLPPAREPSETAKRVSKTIKERIAKHGY